MCLRTQQNSVVERVHYRMVAEKESQSFSSVPLRKIYAKLCRSYQNNFLQLWIHAAVFIQYPGSGRYAYMSSRGYFTKSILTLFGVGSFHMWFVYQTSFLPD